MKITMFEMLESEIDRIWFVQKIANALRLMNNGFESLHNGDDTVNVLPALMQSLKALSRAH